MKNTFGEPIANYFLKTNKNTTTTYDCLDLYAKKQAIVYLDCAECIFEQVAVSIPSNIQRHTFETQMP